MSNQVLGWRRLSKRRNKSAYVSCINHASRCCSATVDRKEGMSSLPVFGRTSSPEWCCASMCLIVKARAFITFGGFKLLPRSDAAARRLYYCLDERNKHVSASPSPTEGDSKTWERKFLDTPMDRWSDGCAENEMCECRTRLPARVDRERACPFGVGRSGIGQLSGWSCQ